MIKIMFVCHGNICRSTMAEFLMKDYVNRLGQSDKFYIASAGTSNEEQGNPVHYGTREILRSLNISCAGKFAVKLKAEDYDKYDYFIGMDAQNLYNMKRIFGGDKDDKIKKLLDFSSRPRDVFDPYWTGDFQATYKDVSEGIKALYEFLTEKDGNRKK